MSDRKVRAVSYRAKLLLFVLGAFAVLFLFRVAYAVLETFSRLDAVEAERDQWQRPSDVIRALDLTTGNIVVDLGCGSGYFTLKLSGAVGDGGRVIAQDIRKLPLMFLWLRALVRHEDNVKILVGDISDPHLPSNVDAVLISNTYHEFTDAPSILAHVYQSLVPAGRLVILDREPKSASRPSSEITEHEVSVNRVQSEVRRAHFEIVSRQDGFIARDSYGESWWLIVARKPS